MSAHVPPGPSVEAAFLDMGDVVGNKIVAEAVALVGGAPEFAGDGIDGFTHAVADSPCVDLYEFAFRRELEHVGAVKFLWVRVGVVDIGVRSDGGEELGAVLGEDEVAGPVSAAAKASAAGQLGQIFSSTACLEISALIGEAHDAVGIADVDVFRIGPAGIEGDAEWLMKSLGKD